MNGARSTGYIVLLALLATLVGHFAIQKHFERRWLAELQQIDSELKLFPSADRSPRDDTFERIHHAFAPARPQLLRTPDAGRVIIPVDDRREDETPRKIQGGSTAPTAVPVPADADPVEESSSDRSADREENLAHVREVIDQELSTSTAEERDIWFEELKSLPAGVVADLLQVRKQLHGLPRLLGGMPERLASTDTTVVPRTPETTAEPVSQRIRFNVYDPRFATEALETAVSQLRHNLVNAATPGFKRLRVTLVDVYNSRTSTDKSDNGRTDGADDPTTLGEGCRAGPFLIDMKPGISKKTARPLDLAIEGNGFFVVRRGDREYLTRCGALTLDRDRQLCLAVTNDSAVLQPVVTIPEDSLEIQIAEDGVVSSKSVESGPFTALGRLQLATVASSARLLPVGNMLFVDTEDSGEARPGDPGTGSRGLIRQGFLEMSNVDVELELAEIEEFSQILKSIPLQSSRPATARNPHLNPNR